MPDLPWIHNQRVISNGPRRLFTAPHSRLAVESAKIPISVAPESAPIHPQSRRATASARPPSDTAYGARPMSGSSCSGAISADGSVAGIMRRGIPTVLASTGPAVNNRVPFARLDANAYAAPESHQDLAGRPRMPVRARGRVRPPDRNIVRQVAIIHHSIRTHIPRK